MKKGLIEKTDKEGFKLVKNAMFDKWDNFKKTNSCNTYLEQGYSISAFIWDTFYKTKLKIGDGIGTSGDILWYGIGNDEHIETAFKAIWNQYLKERS